MPLPLPPRSSLRGARPLRPRVTGRSSGVRAIAAMIPIARGVRRIPLMRMAVRYPCPKMSGGIARTRGKSPPPLGFQPTARPAFCGAGFFVGGASVPLGGGSLFFRPLLAESKADAPADAALGQKGANGAGVSRERKEPSIPPRGGQAEGRGGRLGRHRTGGDSANGEPHPHRRHPHRPCR